MVLVHGDGVENQTLATHGEMRLKTDFWGG
jgi:hypothetical protein